MFNDFASIMHLNSFSTKLNLSEAGTFEKIINHLKTLCTYLFFNESFLPFICVLVLASTIFYSCKTKSKTLFLCVLSAVIFFSPLIILIIQRVIPFERNWLFLIFPSAICLGFVIDNVVNIKIFNSLVNTISKYKLCLNALLLALTIFYFSGFTINHRNFAAFDFKIDELRKEHLNSVINNIKEIGLTNKSNEFYPADVILFICHKEYPQRKVHIGELLNIKNQDILIIDTTELTKFKDQLGNYKLLKHMSDQIAVYGKVGLF
ncbi:MAG: hypothetical protein JNJ41_13200 [Bacteroidia bacterium]|nr:hypothetical protein [Bacteroidia bacterium]